MFVNIATIATMARCEQGYLCDVCGQDVGSIADSGLYLRYIMGEVPPEELHRQPERHVRCNPAVAQFIVAPEFPTVTCPGPFAKNQLDAEYVREQEARVTRAWHRLQELPGLGISIVEYPLPEVIEAWKARKTN